MMIIILKIILIPATLKHGWSKHGFSRIPSKHPQIALLKIMENDGFIIGIVFCKSLMAVGSAGHRYGGTRGASKTCRASNTSDHDFDAVASNMDIDSCSCCLHSWERACQNSLLHSWNGGGCPCISPLLPDISNSDPASHVGRHLRLSCPPSPPPPSLPAKPLQIQSRMAREKHNP